MFFVFVLILIAAVSNVLTENNKVIIVSFDGINHLSINSTYTPELMKVTQEGTGPLLMHTIVPSKTIVTHFSLATGAYSNTHGVYNNTIFDSNYNELPYSQSQFLSNKDIIPIWIENEKKGDGRHSGVMMWPGGEFEYSGSSAKYSQKFDTTIDWDTRVNTIVNWMTQGNEKANFVMAYFESTKCNHRDQVEQHTIDYLTKVDQTIKKLYEKLNNAMGNDFDLIIMSDHGTNLIDYDNILEIESFFASFAESDYKIIQTGPLMFIKPKPEKYAEIMSALEGYRGAVNKFMALGIQDVAERFNMVSDYLRGVIFMLATENFTFMRKAQKEQLLTEVGDQNNVVVLENGYDNWSVHMDTFFSGVGKHFRNIKVTADPVELMDVYQILKKLLDLPGNASNHQILGDITETVKEVLTSDLFPQSNDDTEIGLSSD